MNKSISTSDVIIEKYLSIEVGLLRICGISLTGNESNIYKIYSLVVLFVTFTYPFVQLMGALFNPNRVDFDTVYCLFGIHLGIAKITMMLRKRAQVRETLIKLGRKPFIVNLERGSDAEEELFKECIWIATVQRMVYVTSLTCGLLGTAAYTLANRLRSNDYHDWKLPFGQVLFFDVTVSPTYDLVWLYQMVSVSYLSFSLTAIDLITAFILCYICYQFKFLQNSLHRIVKNSYIKLTKDLPVRINLVILEKDGEVDGSDVSWKYLEESLKEAVSYHLEIIAIVSEMENAFSLLFLIIIFYTTIILCFMIYRLSIIPINNPDVIPNLIEILIYAVQVAILCVWGEQVTHESQKVANAAFEAGYVGTDVRFQKGLMLIIRRSQRPTKLTAAKFTDIRLATFVWIMRATYSSFMLLRNIKGEEQNL